MAETDTMDRLRSRGTSALWSEKNLKFLYVEQKMTVGQIAEFLDCGKDSVDRWRERHGFEARRGRVERCTYLCNGDGYPAACSYNSKDDRPEVVLIHRLVAVAEFGFEAVSGNVIHHKNNISFDNRPDNLAPMKSGEHTKYHAETASEVPPEGFE